MKNVISFIHFVVEINKKEDSKLNHKIIGTDK